MKAGTFMLWNLEAMMISGALWFLVDLPPVAHQVTSAIMLATGGMGTIINVLGFFMGARTLNREYDATLSEVPDSTDKYATRCACCGKPTDVCENVKDVLRQQGAREDEALQEQLVTTLEQARATLQGIADVFVVPAGDAAKADPARLMVSAERTTEVARRALGMFQWLGRV